MQKTTAKRQCYSLWAVNC